MMERRGSNEQAIVILSVAIVSMVVAAQSVFADKITVTQNGHSVTINCSKNNCNVKV